jgi:MFS family permease
MTDSPQDAPALGPAVSLRAAPAAPAHTDLRWLLRLNNLLQLLTNGAWYIGTPFIPLYLTSHGASPSVIGLVVGLSGVAPLAVALHAGGLVDERGPTVVLVVSVVVFGLGAAMLTVLQGIAAVTVAYTLMVGANIGLAVASQAIVATVSTAANRVANYGHYALSYSAGAVIGPIVGGVLASRFGYPAAFFAMTLVAVPSLVTACLLRGVPRSRRAVAASTVHRYVGTVLRMRGVGAILFASSIMMCAQALQGTFYPLYLSKNGLPAVLIGVAVAVSSLTSMAVRAFLAGAVAWLGQPGTLAAAMALMGVALGSAPLLHAFWPLIGVSGLMGVSLGFTQPLSMSLLAEAVADEFWGVAFGIRQSVQRTVGVISPFAFGVASAARGIESAFYLGALVMLGAAGLMTKMSSALERREAP